MKFVYKWNMYNRYNVSRKSFLIVLLFVYFLVRDLSLTFLIRDLCKYFFNSTFARGHLDRLRLKILLKAT